MTLDQRLDAPDFVIPNAGGPWLKTLAPVALSERPWIVDTPGTCFTSIMRWDGFQDANHQGKTYGGKDDEPARSNDMPQSWREVE